MKKAVVRRRPHHGIEQADRPAGIVAKIFARILHRLPGFDEAAIWMTASMALALSVADISA